jgi:hypothetical protein
MTNHKVTAFADFDAFKTYVDAIVSTTTIQVIYSPEKGWIVVE